MATPTVSGTKSCTTCPSLLAPDQQPALLGTSLSGDVCAIKLLPLIKPLQSQAAKARAQGFLARGCNKYGKDINTTPLAFDAAPSMRVGMDVNPYPADNNQDIASCSTCANRVAPRKVVIATGWTGSICRSTGNLMLGGDWEREDAYAKQCGGYVQYDPTRHAPAELDKFMFLPQFRDDVGLVDQAKAYKMSMDLMQDPRTMASDPERPNVTEFMVKHNIRAWRKISDPEGYGADIFLPIYDSSKWTKEQYDHVPQIGDQETPEKYADHGGHIYAIAVLWRMLEETPMAWGPGGVGKTEIFRHIAWLMQLPFYRYSISGETTIDQIFGSMRFLDGETVYQRVGLAATWDQPGVSFVDEPNTAEDEVWQALRSTMDNSKTITLASDRGQVIHQGPDTYFGMAGNPNWDILNVGTKVVSDPDMSRLTHLFFDYPPRELEAEILRQRAPMVTEQQITYILNATADMREHSRQGKIDTSWGVRHNIKLARALEYFTPTRAFKLVIADALPLPQVEMIQQIVTSQFKAS